MPLAYFRSEHGVVTTELPAQMRERFGPDALVTELSAAGHHPMIDQPRQWSTRCGPRSRPGICRDVPRCPPCRSAPNHNRTGRVLSDSRSPDRANRCAGPGNLCEPAQEIVKAIARRTRPRAILSTALLQVGTDDRGVIARVLPSEFSVFEDRGCKGGSSDDWASDIVLLDCPTPRFAFHYCAV